MAIGVISVLFGAVSYMMGMIQGVSALGRKFEYFINENIPNQIPPIANLIDEVFKEKISYNEYVEKMKKLGYDEKEAKRLFETSKRYLDASNIVLLYWRHELDPFSDENNKKEFYHRMKALGFDEKEADLFEKACRYYPSPTDFIRFAVRDVFVPERVKKYQLDEDFPEDIVPYAEKSGMSPELLKWYWRAHWELPSVESVMRMVNMLQPEVINTKLPDGSRYGDKYKDFGIDSNKIITTYDDLSEYLKMADISPYWRDRIKALTFPPLTRVDLRRIYELGLISDEELKARLLELGYSIKDAEKLMEFYKIYKMSHEKDLTRSQIEKAYKEGELKRNEAKKYLIDLGYDENESELILSLIDNEIESEIEEEQIRTLQYLFRTGLIDIQKLNDELDKMNVSAARKDRIITQLLYEKRRKIALPSKSDLLSWLKTGLIDKKTFVEKMERLGYRDEDIKLYYKAVTGKELQGVT